jgi:transposase
VRVLEVRGAAFAEPLERLQTVPGVGPIVAATAVAVFSDIHRFPTAKHAVKTGVPCEKREGVQRPRSSRYVNSAVLCEKLRVVSVRDRAVRQLSRLWPLSALNQDWVFHDIFQKCLS